MRIAPEPAIEGRELFVQHGVAGDRVGEGVEFVLRGQLAVQEQIGDLHEGGLFRELADRITAMEQNALIAVYIGEPRFAARGRGARTSVVSGKSVSLRVDLCCRRLLKKKKTK